MEGAFLLFYAINLVSISWALNFSEAIFNTQKYALFGISYFIFRILISNYKLFYPFVRKLTIILSITILCVLAFQFLRFGGIDVLNGNNIYTLIGTSGHKNLISSFLFLLVGLHLFFGLRKGIDRKDILLISILILFLLVLRSRATLLAVLILFIPLLVYKANSNDLIRKLFYFRGLPLVFGTLILFIVSYKLSPTEASWKTGFEDSFSFKNESSMERLFIWVKTKELIKDRTLLGCGTGNWKIHFPGKGIQGAYRLQEQDVVFTRAHNDFMEVWAETGIFGFLTFISLFLIGIGEAIRGMKKSGPKGREQYLVLLLILLGYIAISMFDFPKERIEHLTFLALVFAIIIAKGKRKTDKTYPVNVLKGLMIGAGLILLINLPIGYFRIVGGSYANKITQAQEKEDWKSIRELARKGHSKFYTINNAGAPLKWFEGISYYYEEDFENAKIHFEHAMKDNPFNFNVLNNYATSLIQLEQYEEALPLYAKAININPKFDEGRFNLAFALYQLEEYERALNQVNLTRFDEAKKKQFQDWINKAMNPGANGGF